MAQRGINWSPVYYQKLSQQWLFPKFLKYLTCSNFISSSQLLNSVRTLLFIDCICVFCPYHWNVDHIYGMLNMSAACWFYLWANVIKCQMLWNVKCHEMSNVTKCQMSLNVKSHEISNVKCHEMSRVMKCQMLNVMKYKMLNVMKCQESWKVKCHEMSNVKKFHEMSRVMKC